MLTGPLITLAPSNVTEPAVFEIIIPPEPLQVDGNSILVTCAAFPLYRKAAATPYVG